MKVSLRPITKTRALKYIDMQAKLSLKEILALLALLLAYALIPYLFGQQNCIFKAIFGLPCPGCGMTRAWISAIKFNFADAFFFHPLFWILPIALVLWLGFRIKDMEVPNCLIYGFIALMLVVYVVRMLTMFPELEPLAFNSDSILAKLLLR